MKDAFQPKRLGLSASTLGDDNGTLGIPKNVLRCRHPQGHAGDRCPWDRQGVLAAPPAAAPSTLAPNCCA